MFLSQNLGRNSIIGDEYRWPKVIPYYLEDDLGEHLHSETHSFGQKYSDCTVLISFVITDLMLLITKFSMGRY